MLTLCACNSHTNQNKEGTTTTVVSSDVNGGENTSKNSDKTTKKSEDKTDKNSKKKESSTLETVEDVEGAEEATIPFETEDDSGKTTKKSGKEKTTKKDSKESTTQESYELPVIPIP